MVRTLHAYCFASGEIEFSENIPDGAVHIKKNCSQEDIAKIKVRSRLSYDGKTHLVPGVPEADNQREGMDAVFRFRDFIQK